METEGLPQDYENPPSTTGALLLRGLAHLDAAAECFERLGERRPGAATAAVCVRGLANALPGAPIAEELPPPTVRSAWSDRDG